MAKVMTDEKASFGIPSGSTTIDIPEGYLVTLDSGSIALSTATSHAVFPVVQDIVDGHVERGMGSGDDTVLLYTDSVLVELVAADTIGNDIAVFVPGYVVAAAANGKYLAYAYPTSTGTYYLIGAVVSNDGTKAIVYIEPGVSDQVIVA